MNSNGLLQCPNYSMVRYSIGVWMYSTPVYVWSTAPTVTTAHSVNLAHWTHFEPVTQSLALALLSRTIAWSRSRIRFLEERDANTKIFHLQACHRSRKNNIPAIEHEGRWFSAEEEKQDLIFNYYNTILGGPFNRQHALNLDGLLPQLDLSGIDACFSEEEIWETIKDTMLDRAPGPDGFTAAFYKATW